VWERGYETEAKAKLIGFTPESALAMLFGEAATLRGRASFMPSLIERIWNTSPGSLTRAVQRRVRNWRAHEGWFTVRGGPAAGIRLYLPTTEGAYEEMIQGTFDAFIYEALRGRCEVADTVCWDIGAHIGYHALAFAALGARVLAFEPNPFNAERLHLHVANNPNLAPRIRHLPVAVSDREGEMAFLQSAELSGSSSGSHLTAATTPLGRTAYASFRETTVRTTRMDTLIAQGEPPPDVVKMDIEGAEHLALQGAARLLSEHRPLFLIEVHHIHLMFHLQRLFLKAGYSTSLLDEQNSSPSRCFILAEFSGSRK
jgi:FkbM family methyltransferase